MTAERQPPIRDSLRLTVTGDPLDTTFHPRARGTPMCGPLAGNPEDPDNLPVFLVVGVNGLAVEIEMPLEYARQVTEALSHQVRWATERAGQLRARAHEEEQARLAAGEPTPKRRPKRGGVIRPMPVPHATPAELRAAFDKQE